MSREIKPDALYCTDDLAEVLKVKPAAVRRLIRKGRLSGSKLGRRWWVRGADVLAAVQEKHVRSE